MKIKRPNSYRVGYVAECYVVLELAKRDLFATRMYKDYHYDYDFALSNGLKIEVKSSNILKHKDKRRGPNYFRETWAFNNPDRYYDDDMKQVDRGGRNRKCDFYILVCMDEGVPQRYYIVPTEIIQARQIITIPVTRKANSEFSLEDFREKWELITKDYTTSKGGFTNNEK